MTGGPDPAPDGRTTDGADEEAAREWRRGIERKADAAGQDGRRDLEIDRVPDLDEVHLVDGGDVGEGAD